MSRQLKRRQFLNAGSAGGLALGFPPLLALPVHAAPRNAPVPERVMQAAAASPWTALSSSVPLGQPLANISITDLYNARAGCRLLPATSAARHGSAGLAYDERRS